MEKKVENHVVNEEDPHKRVGNLFAVVDKEEDDDTIFWQPIWSRQIFTLFSDPTRRPMTHVFCFCLQHKPKSTSNLKFIDRCIHTFNEVQETRPQFNFLHSYKMGFSSFSENSAHSFTIEDFLNNLVLGFIGLIMKD